ncbi:MAG: FtsX-like permease family protein [Pseudomonadales bacterium]|jgi:ABC-type lipoprotein release transport system permease subunit|nr:FtsX-like permease family protein [Pseudomonadales bacterium]MDP7357825.1 FtsX-like permease family protein [Pseudomonadales bacterium]MDP7596788.1 FtsX-like permease family protein [Pseudomonadales bacterium]HJN51592.1 FtsX-like permease family protein [Pseudomonadales bacterium]|tara:strand:- start:49 stop:1260 length:1212 start_codon:yes stop_codon:yes gene_type:complete
MAISLLVQLSVRNIVRHRRRNLMLLLAIAVAVFTVLMATTMIRGMQYDIRDQAISNLNGHIKIHAYGYLDDPNIARGFELAKEWQPKDHAQEIQGWAARIRIPAVIMSERETRGIQFVGIDPARESISFLGKASYDGDPLSSSSDRHIVIGREMAEQLETKVGRRLVIITQGADGLNREAGFRISGIYDAEGTAIEKIFVFTGVAALQKMVDTEVVTELSVRLVDDVFQMGMLDSLIGFFSHLEVKTWQQLEPMAAAFFVFAEGAVFIYFFIVMTALIFGLVNTLVTSVMERVHELGMLRAVGMRPGAVVLQVVLESTFIMMIGVAIGLTLGWVTFQFIPPVLDWSAFGEGFERFGVPAKLHLRMHVSDMVLITVLSMVFGVLASLYPARRAVIISPLEALRR